MNRKIFNKLKNILFLDIETVSQKPSFEDLDHTTKSLWEKKAGFFRAEEKSPAELYKEKAAIYAEFGRVIVLGLGYFQMDSSDEVKFRTKVFYFKDERKILSEFKNFMKTKFSEKSLILCAHNGKEFDFPYLSRRLIINGQSLPPALDIGGLKPWEVPHSDTMEMWKFGDYKNFTSLELLAHILDIPDRESDMNGSMVHDVYYNQQDIEHIARYCVQDVVLCAQLYLKLNGMPYLESTQIQKL